MSNLDGEHWLAFFIKPMEILVFDPYGFYYPALLVTKLQSVGKISTIIEINIRVSILKTVVNIALSGCV